MKEVLMLVDGEELSEFQKMLPAFLYVSTKQRNNVGKIHKLLLKAFNRRVIEKDSLSTEFQVERDSFAIDMVILGGMLNDLHLSKRKRGLHEAGMAHVPDGYLAFVKWLFEREAENGLETVLKEHYGSKEYKKYFKAVKDLRDITRSLVKKYDGILDGSGRLNSIVFWTAEYSKRRFYRKMLGSGEFLDCFYYIFKTLQSNCVAFSEEFREECHFYEEEKERTDVGIGRLLTDTIGCDVCSCNFRKQGLALIQNALAQIELSGKIQLNPEILEEMIGFDIVKAYLKPLALDAITYNLHLCEMFSLPSPGSLLDFIQCNGRYPKQELVMGPTFDLSSVKSTSTTVRLKKLLTEYKKIYCEGNYHENYEAHLFGLWLWDRECLFQVGTGCKNEDIEALITEPWYGRTSFGAKSLEKLSVDDAHAKYDRKEIFQAHRSHYQMAKRSIEEWKIVPLVDKKR